jgi:hypothetical protein
MGRIQTLAGSVSFSVTPWMRHAREYGYANDADKNRVRDVATTLVPEPSRRMFRLELSRRSGEAISGFISTLKPPGFDSASLEAERSSCEGLGRYNCSHMPLRKPRRGAQKGDTVNRHAVNIPMTPDLISHRPSLGCASPWARAAEAIAPANRDCSRAQGPVEPGTPPA